MQIINDLMLIKHSINVALVSFFTAKKIKLSRNQYVNIFFAGLLHDIGKIKLDQKILNKKDKLTLDEYEHVKHHVILGVELLKKYNISEEIINIIEQHHECDDGTGYPNRLKDDEICIEAKIIRRSDIYDALTSNRPYRKKYTKKHAMKIIEQMEEENKL